MDPQQATAHEPESTNETEVVASGDIMVNTKRHKAVTIGHPEMDFVTESAINRSPEGGITEQRTTHAFFATGCGCYLTSRSEVAYESIVSGKAVCKGCALRCRTLQADTRFGISKCGHNVAPNEMEPVEEHGYVCPLCRQKLRKITLKKIFNAITLILQSLGLIEKKEIPYETEQPPQPNDQYPWIVQGPSSSWPGYPPNYQKYHGEPERGSRQPDTHGIPPGRN
jgi:hypothetical protein